LSFTTLIIILGILSFLLIILFSSYLVFPEEKVIKKKDVFVKKEPVGAKKIGNLSFEDISKVFASKTSSKQDLLDAIENLIRYHGRIHAKMGDLAHPDFKKYSDLIMTMCSNPQADKDTIVALDKKLRIKNPKYGLDIDEAVNKGLAARGF